MDCKKQKVLKMNLNDQIEKLTQLITDLRMKRVIIHAAILSGKLAEHEYADAKDSLYTCIGLIDDFQSDLNLLESKIKAK